MQRAVGQISMRPLIPSWTVPPPSNLTQVPCAAQYTAQDRTRQMMMIMGVVRELLVIWSFC